MHLIRQFSSRLNWRYVILGVVVWWVAMLIAYSILSLRVNHLKVRLKNTGIELTNEFAKLVSLPLLEKDSQSIHRLLTEAAGRYGVFYASVVDHRNKVVAFTGTGHLMPALTQTARAVDKVSIQEGGFASHASIVNFISDITYAGTKIGEIFIGMSTPKAIQTQKIFMIIAIASGLILLILIILLRYQWIRAALPNMLQLGPSTGKGETGATATPVVCPLCGTRTSLSARIFKQSKLDPYLISGKTKPNDSANALTNNPEKATTPITRSDDIAWLKRRIILRCTEIIKKLTA